MAEIEDSWETAERLGALSLSERPAQSTAGDACPATTSAEDKVLVADLDKPSTLTPESALGEQSRQPVQTPQQPASASASEYGELDLAIRQALADPTQRVTVLRCEELVEKFLADPCQEALQFPANFTGYQRMLAHRVSQYHGLQTTTVDYEDSQGRVLGIRTQHCEVPKARLRDLNIRPDPAAQRHTAGNGVGGHADHKPRLLRRQDDPNAALGASDLTLNQSPARSMKERHENYQKAREELGLGSQDGMGRGGGRGGRFGGALGGRGMDGGRGRKAVFRDKEKDLNDPDYRRGMNRFNGASRFDPSYAAAPAGGIYQVPTYSSEFPSLGRMPSNNATGAGRPHATGGPGSAQQGPHGATQMGGAQQLSMAGPGGHAGQTGGGPWGQQPGQQGQGGMRQPPPPPPPHHHQATGPGGSSGPSGRGGGSMGGRQQPQQTQQQAAYGATMTGGAYHGMGGQYPAAVPVAGFVQAGSGQPVFGMAATGGALPAGAMYAAHAPAAGMGGAFYPAGMGAMGMGAMGMGAMGMVPAAGAYGYMAAPASGMGMGAQGEAIALSPQGAYPVYASYPGAAATAMYPAAAAAQMGPAAAMHPGGGGAIPMRPVYGVPTAFYQYDPSQYGSSPGAQAAMQAHGDGRGYGGYSGGHHGASHAHPHHGGSHQHGGGRGRDSDAAHGSGAGGDGR